MLKGLTKLYFHICVSFYPSLRADIAIGVFVWLRCVWLTRGCRRVKPRITRPRCGNRLIQRSEKHPDCDRPRSPIVAIYDPVGTNICLAVIRENTEALFLSQLSNSLQAFPNSLSFSYKKKRTAVCLLKY